MTRPHPAADPRQHADLMCRVLTATHYSYEAGDYPDGLDPDVWEYIAGDGGLLNALDDARRLAVALDKAQLSIRQLRRERARESLLHMLTLRFLAEDRAELEQLRARLATYETENPS